MMRRILRTAVALGSLTMLGGAPALWAQGEETAREIEGLTYVLEENELGFEAFFLSFMAEEALLSWTTSRTDVGLAGDYIVGLDGFPRRWPERPGPRWRPATAQGGWESESVFSAEVQRVGGGSHWRFRFIFRDDGVSVEVHDLDEGSTTTISGALAEWERTPIESPVTVTAPFDFRIRINIRTGANTRRHPMIARMVPGRPYPVIARDESGERLQVGPQRWIPAAAVRVEGPVESLPVVRSPLP
jgi:hypothetical protein